MPIKEFTLVALTTAVVTLLLTGLVRLLAFRIGAVAVPRARDVHARPMPRMGGVAMYGGVCAGMALAHQLPVLRRSFDYGLDPIAVLVGGGLIVAVGILDDRFELDSLTKAAGQITAAGVLVLFGVQWVMFWVPWGGAGAGSVLVLDENMGGVLVIVLTFALVNALNFVDGLDGLAAGIGLIAAVATGAFALVLLANNGGDVSAYPPALIAATLAGSCLGFLPHNFQPARIFMGDSGSMLIGLMLAAGATSASGKVNYQTFSATDAIGLLSPVIVLVAVLFIPLLDLLLAVLRRVRNGTSWAKPDKMHLHHRMLEVGHSQRRAVLLIYLWASVLAFGAVALTVFNVYLVAAGVAVCLVAALLVSVIPRLRERSGRG